MHAGYLRTNCETCDHFEQDVKDALGCNPNMAAANPAWQLQGETVISYMNCARMFIPESVFNFYKAYKGYKNARFTLPTESNQPRKYLGMCDVYESALPHFQALKADDERRQAAIDRIPRI